MRKWIGPVATGLAVGVVLTAVALSFLPGMSLFGHDRQIDSTQVIKQVTREEQVVLLSLAIEDITEARDASHLWGDIEIPGSERATFIRFGFVAKIGIDGKDVQIKDLPGNKFQITIPEFIFIGQDRQHVKLVVEDGGLLSFLTPEIDQVELVNEILNNSTKDEYVDDYRDLLESQAERFYGNLIKVVDPEAEVSFEFK
ncbi:MAG TPA: hypothetical protein PKM12_08335 [Marmoricola sp.]|nr:hypothetical protein [Marmoricola sp.]